MSRVRTKGRRAIAAVLCGPLPDGSELCVSTSPEGVEVFIADDPMQSSVRGVGIDCLEGH